MNVKSTLLGLVVLALVAAGVWWVRPSPPLRTGGSAGNAPLRLADRAVLER